MPRTLPWKRNQAPQSQTGAKAESQDSTTAVAPGRSAIRTPAHQGIGSGSKARRTPSTSPPPAPPAENPMLDGYDADDKYRMVEDEFLTVAGTFTAHLHKAEYQRLKKLASNRNRDTIQSISRPVVGGMTDTVRRAQAARDLDAKQRKGLRGADGDSDSDDGQTAWAGTALQGLMDSPRRKAVRLTSLSSSQAGASISRNPIRWEASMTRPSHGTRAGTEPDVETTDSNDDDLDAPSSLVAPAVRRKTVEHRPSQQPRRNETAAGSSESRAPESRAPRDDGGEPTVQDDSDSLDDFGSSIRRRLKERRSRQKLRARREDGDEAESQPDGEVASTGREPGESLSFVPSFI